MERQGELTLEVESVRPLGPTAQYACLGVAVLLVIAAVAIVLLVRWRKR